MLSDFAEILEHRGGIAACALVVRELPSTLLREHLDDPTAMKFLLRLFLGAIPPLAIYTAALSRAARVEEIVLITFWTLCILAALLKTRCRGLSCLVRTMLASIAGLLLPLAFINSYQPMTPGLSTLLIPLSMLALTIGLIFAAYARLVMEGLVVKNSRTTT